MSIWFNVGPDTPSRSTGQHATTTTTAAAAPGGKPSNQPCWGSRESGRSIRNEPPSARMRPAESSSCGNQPPPLTGAWSVTLPLRRGAVGGAARDQSPAGGAVPCAERSVARLIAAANSASPRSVTCAPAVRNGRRPASKAKATDGLRRRRRCCSRRREGSWGGHYHHAMQDVGR
jgi:hypothetical protein